MFASLIPADDFLSSLNNVDRIIEATLYAEKKVLGSGFLNLMPIDASAQDDLAISIKAKRRESLTKSAMKAMISSIVSVTFGVISGISAFKDNCNEI